MFIKAVLCPVPFLSFVISAATFHPALSITSGHHACRPTSAESVIGFLEDFIQVEKTKEDVSRRRGLKGSSHGLDAPV
jgi:hypothetical protein